MGRSHPRFVCNQLPSKLANSVTGFGKKLPLWQNHQSLGQLLRVFSIWQNFEPDLANFAWFWAYFH